MDDRKKLEKVLKEETDEMISRILAKMFGEDEEADEPEEEEETEEEDTPKAGKKKADPEEDEEEEEETEKEEEEDEKPKKSKDEDEEEEEEKPKPFYPTADQIESAPDLQTDKARMSLAKWVGGKEFAAALSVKREMTQKEVLKHLCCLAEGTEYEADEKYVALAVKLLGVKESKVEAHVKALRAKAQAAQNDAESGTSSSAEEEDEEPEHTGGTKADSAADEEQSGEVPPAIKSLLKEAKSSGVVPVTRTHIPFMRPACRKMWPDIPLCDWKKIGLPEWQLLIAYVESKGKTKKVPAKEVKKPKAKKVVKRGRK